MAVRCGHVCVVCVHVCILGVCMPLLQASEWVWPLKATVEDRGHTCTLGRRRWVGWRSRWGQRRN